MLSAVAARKAAAAAPNPQKTSISHAPPPQTTPISKTASPTPDRSTPVSRKRKRVAPPSSTGDSSTRKAKGTAQSQPPVARSSNDDEESLPMTTKVPNQRRAFSPSRPVEDVRDVTNGDVSMSLGESENDDIFQSGTPKYVQREFWVSLNPHGFLVLQHSPTGSFHVHRNNRQQSIFSRGRRAL